MIIIVRTRRKDSVRKETLNALADMKADYIIAVHPESLTFAQFHNKIFSELNNDELYCFLDDDIVPNERLYMMERHLNSYPEVIAVCGVARANHNKVMLMQSFCIKKNFNFATCIIRGRFLKDIRIPEYLECCEDDWVRKELNECHKRYEVMDFSFDHLSDDWETKFLKGLEWHTANASLHYSKNGYVLDEICPFKATFKGIEEYCQRLYTMMSRIDRKLASKAIISIRQGFADYENKLKNR